MIHDFDMNYIKNLIFVVQFVVLIVVIGSTGDTTIRNESLVSREKRLDGYQITSDLSNSLVIKKTNQTNKTPSDNTNH